MTTDNNYNNAVAYLYSLQKYGIKLGLSNTEKLMKILGEPHNAFRSIHVAGTNGKGSTATAIASILKYQGLKVGLFTSPHLVSFTERIQINNVRISEQEVIKLASEIKDAISDKDLNPTFFEFVTAMAFYYFKSQNIDWAVVETGMGGRLDATNVITPEVSVITNVGYDHREFLGSTLSDIAYEKAGIIKPGVPVITSSNLEEVLRQLSDIAALRKSELNIYGREFSGNLIQMLENQIVIDYSGLSEYRNLYASVTGRYQLYNICMAIRTCEILRQKGFDINDESIINGLAEIPLEGRLEWVSHSPPIIIDGAHNPDASSSLADSLRELYPDKKIIIIAGIMADKDIRDILSPLIGISDIMILTSPKYERAATSGKLMSVLNEIKSSDTSGTRREVFCTGTVSDSLELAGRLCDQDHIILATGSFYTIGEVKEALGSKGVLSDLRESLGIKAGK